MASKNLASMYNPIDKEESKETPEQHRACKASGCRLLASLYIGSGPWLCTYHANTPKFCWDQITEMLIKNDRIIRMTYIVDSLGCHEFDQIQKANAWAIDEMIMPTPDENYIHWSLRTKETVHKAIKNQVKKIIDSSQAEFTCLKTGVKNASWAVSQLTNGTLLKKHKTKTREEQMKELKEKQMEWEREKAGTMH